MRNKRAFQFHVKGHTSRMQCGNTMRIFCCEKKINFENEVSKLWILERSKCEKSLMILDRINFVCFWKLKKLGKIAPLNLPNHTWCVSGFISGTQIKTPENDTAYVAVLWPICTCNFAAILDAIKALITICSFTSF